MSLTANRIFTHLLLGGLFAYSILLLALYSGGSQLWQNLYAYEQQVIPAQRISSLTVQANLAFKLQVQEWKNTLLRSTDQDSYIRLKYRFLNAQDHVSKQIEQLQKTLTRPDEKAMLLKFIEAHKTLSNQYASALTIFEHEAFQHQKADEFMQGKDRPLSDILEDLSDLAEQRAFTVATDTKEASRLAILWTIIGVVVGIGGSAFVFIVLMRYIVLLPTRQAFEELRQATEKLSQAERMAALGGLVAGVAHEINTPIGISLTCASSLQEASNAMQTKMQNGAIRKQDMIDFLNSAKECSSLITANAFRAANLIQSFKQIAVDQTSEARRKFELDSYIHEILTSLRPQFKRTSIQILVDCPPNLYLDSYPGALSQALSNIILNALQHGLCEQLDGTITIKAELQEKEQVCLSIHDNGCGIAPENMKKIFDPFFTTKRQNGGSGLGLHIAYNIVTQILNGSIAIQSQLGSGSTFILHIPLQAPQLPQSEEKN